MNVQIFSKVVKQVTIYNVVKPMAFLRLVRPEWSHKKKKKIYDSRRFSKRNYIFAAKRAWVSPQKRKKIFTILALGIFPTGQAWVPLQGKIYIFTILSQGIFSTGRVQSTHNKK